jgi:Protein of unknown function (DUF1573)
MKYFVQITCISLLLAACQNTESEGVREIRTTEGPNSGIVRNPISADQPLDTTQLARIKFEAPEHDFGTAKEGSTVIHEFKFTNTGKMPLSILDARASCGCTVPDWPKEPIAPGGTGAIKAKFNTEGREGRQSKTITVRANTFPNETEIYLRGEVLKK